MEGEREDIGVVFEERCRAIALMYVEIEDGRAQMQRSNGHSEVIEHAEARAVVREGVMCPTGERAAPSGVERLASGGERSTHRTERAADQPLGPRESEPPHRGIIERAFTERLNIGGIMRKCNFLRIGLRRFDEFKHARRRQQIPQHPVFPLGETMARRQRDLVVIAIEKPLHLLVRSRMCMSLKRMLPWPPE